MKQERPKKFRMVIDLDKCTGCGACVKACPVEAMSLVLDKKQV